MVTTGFSYKGRRTTGNLPKIQHPVLRTLILVCAAVLACLSSLPYRAESRTAPETASSLPDKGWVTMPAGARSAYMGIHGGTVPVSLLATSEGTSLVSFVGQTGNDFLELLHRADVRMPSLLNATSPRGKDCTLPGFGDLRRYSVRHLMAGNATSSLPVIYLSGDTLVRLAANPDMLRPFGLSDNPLSIEGEIAMPDPFAHAPKYHILVDPRYLQPHRQ